MPHAVVSQEIYHSAFEVFSTVVLGDIKNNDLKQWSLTPGPWTVPGRGQEENTLMLD